MEKILNEIKDGDLIITPLKRKILKTISLEKKLLNIKILTKEEFIKKYFGEYTEKSRYILMKKYNLKYSVASEYLKNLIFDIPFLEKYKKELSKEETNENFKKSFKRIVVIGYENIDKYLKDIFENYEILYINFQTKNYNPKVFEFEKQTDEIAFICEDIIKKTKDININKIYLVNVTDDNIFEIKRLFKLYNIPINLNEKKSIYGTETCNIFLKNLNGTKNINDSLEKTPQNEIYNKIINVLNRYTFVKEVDDVFLEIIKNELKETYIQSKKFNNAVNVVGIDELIATNDEHYYILDFNQGLLPRSFKDDDLIKDTEKKKLGLNTSLENLKFEKKHLTNIIRSVENLTITYKHKDKFQTYFPSPLIDELGLEVVSNMQTNFTFSNAYNKLLLASYLDDYINFNVKNKNLETLYSLYSSFPYQTYDNSFKFNDKKVLKKYLKNNVRLSYSSINNYFLCGFRFYISSILKLEPYEERFSTLIGNLFHYCLSKMYGEKFILKEEYQNYIKDKEINYKEKFFIDKLYSELELIIEIIKEMEANTSLKNVLTEKKIEVKINENITFVGIIDKIMYLKLDDKYILNIIDYKTGNPESTLDNINYGFNLQLPSYIYLLRNSDFKNVKISGFYLQKILNSKKTDKDILLEMKSDLKLDGYTNIDIDYSCENMDVIKGLKKTKNGFSKTAKLINNNKIDTVYGIVSSKINEVVKSIDDACFPINPKNIDGKLKGCEYCNFKDLCFKKEEDVVYLEKRKFEDIVKEVE